MDGTENPVIDAGEFLGEDGVFKENYLEQMYPEGDPMRTDPTLINTKGVRSMASQLVNSQKQIGLFSSGREFAILPNEQSDEAEINEYRTKTGVPATAADYKLNEMQLPEGLPRDDKLAEHMGNVLHKAGASGKIATAVHNGYAEYIKSTMEAVVTQEKLDDATANKVLRGKLGAAYDKTMRDIGTLVNLFGNEIDPVETANLLKELPNDSFAAQLLGKIAERFGEDVLKIPVDSTSGELTPDAAMAEANKIMTDPYYITDRPKDKPVNKAYHDELVLKVQNLIEISVKGR